MYCVVLVVSCYHMPFSAMLLYVVQDNKYIDDVCYTVLCCAVLCCAVLCCAMLHSISHVVRFIAFSPWQKQWAMLNSQGCHLCCAAFCPSGTC